MLDPLLPTAQAMLCEYADVTEGKLLAVGAGLTRVPTRPEPPYVIHVALALLVRIPWSATDTERRMTVELVSDLGGAAGPGGASSERVPINYGPQTYLPEDERGVILLGINVGRPADMQPGEDALMPIALPMYGRELPRLGSYFFAIRIEDVEVDRISFRAVAPARATRDDAPESA